MATRLILLPFAAELPASSYPQQQVVNNRPVLAYDASSDEQCDWTSIAPQGLTGTITLVLSFMMASATSGSVRWEAYIEAVTDADALDLDGTTSFDATNSAGATVPATAGYIKQVSITLTNADSLAAADYYRVRLRRDADGTTGTDDATGDAYLLAAELRDGA